MKFLSIVLCLLVSLHSSVAASDGLAVQILKEYKAAKGLCLTIAGSEQLAAEIAANSNMLVHALVADENTRLKTLAAIEKNQVSGQAAVEILEGKNLMFVPNSINLIVVEDFSALSKHGIDRREVLRVLAPYGMLYTKEKGQWTKFVKQRPERMADYSHPNNLDSGNMVARDKEIAFPLGTRWIAGLPKNINSWASARAWVISGKRCFIRTANVIENRQKSGRNKHYLVCRDAFNGLPLWKLSLDTNEEDGAGLVFENSDKLAAEGNFVYTVKGQDVIIIDAVSGKIVKTLDVAYKPMRLVKHGSTLTVASWKEIAGPKVKLEAYETASLWNRWVNNSDTGAVQAFDAASGELKWQKDLSVQTLRAFDNKIYTVSRTYKEIQSKESNRREVLVVSRKVVDSSTLHCFDSVSGKEIWKVSDKQLGDKSNIHLNLVAEGVVVVSARENSALLVLSAASGKLLWKLNGFDPVKKRLSGRKISLMVVVKDGEVLFDDKRYDAKTGKDLGNLNARLPTQECTPSMLFGDILTQSRSCNYVDLTKSGAAQKFTFTAARGACMQGMVPANGMVYTSQNNCSCAPGQVLGFLAFGPETPLPSAADFAKERPVIQGPAFNKAKISPPKAGEWAVYRSNNQRNRKSFSAAPANLEVNWSAKIDLAYAESMKQVWAARMAFNYTPPVVADGKVFTASTDGGKVTCFDAASGSVLWNTQLPSRLSSAPLIIGNTCIVSCNNGCLYSLLNSDGRLVWKTRIAPLAQRIVVNARVESTWPVSAAVYYKGSIVATAGRGTEADNGIAVVQLDAQTGKTLFATAISPGPNVRADSLIEVDGKLRHKSTVVDVEGKLVEPGAPHTRKSTIKMEFRERDYILDAYLVLARLRGMGNMMAAWDEKAGYRLEGRGLLASYDSLVVESIHPNFRKGLTPSVKFWAVAAKGGNTIGMALNEDKIFLCQALRSDGSISVFERRTGKVVSKVKLPSMPVYDGMALAYGKLYIMLSTGELLCLGK